jgi:serine/threonine protein kinase
VYLAYAKNCPHDTFQKFAIKEVKTHGLSGSVDGTYKEEEADIWRDLSHPCIIKFYEHIETPYANYFVLELAEGGELFEYVLDDHKNQTSNERAAKVQFYQILRALDYLHVDSTICHRDLKLENILLMTKNKAGRIKITDFGLSRAATGTMNSYVGTPYYIAPEVVRNEDIPNRLAYTVKADVWSAGCILYSLLCGGQAFTGSDKQVKKDILKGRYSMSDGSWEDRSAECKNLVAKMLTGDPEMRPTAWEALNHPWFVDDPHLVHEAELVMSGKKEAANLDVPRSMSVTGDLGIVYTSLAFSLGL